MAGGQGTRLRPLTTATNKHLLPIYDKPLIYYPLTTLLLTGIREITLITSPSEIRNFENLLGDGTQLGIEICYIPQKKSEGIAQGLILAKEFINGEKCCLILGDNLFHGTGLGRQLSGFRQVKGANIFGYKVSNPQDYGVVVLDEKGKPQKIEEKPEFPKSSLAIPGIYFYDENAVNYAESLTPSKRGELEITDLNRIYLEKRKLEVTQLSQGTAWLDTGTFEGLYDAASYIRVMEQRQNSRIGDPFEAARVQGWI
jgi:glucose-1-phosphate thymidylyltransferase